MEKVEIQIIKQLINRYDYGGAMEMVEGSEIPDKKIINLLHCCEQGLNFDFKIALRMFLQWNDEMPLDRNMEAFKRNLEDLIDGRPEAIFSELIENMRIQLDNHRYIDFLSRVYRLKEAVLKYIFVKNHIDKNAISFTSEVFSKRMILKILRKKYKIYNPNLSFAITSYIEKHLNKDHRYRHILDILNNHKMDEIIELRHSGIGGHGFKGVNRDELNNIYGNPYYIIDDFSGVLKIMGIVVKENKYGNMNEYILDRL